MSDAAEREIVKLREQLRQHHQLFAAAVLSAPGRELFIDDNALLEVGPKTRIVRVQDPIERRHRFTVEEGK
jgi:hypothetical protein